MYHNQIPFQTSGLQLFRALRAESPEQYGPAPKSQALTRQDYRRLIAEMLD